MNKQKDGPIGVRISLIQYNYFCMNNKKTKFNILGKQDDIEQVYQKAARNKEDIEEFYLKNKMKLPPILQSRNLVMDHLLPKYSPRQKDLNKSYYKSLFVLDNKDGSDDRILVKRNIAESSPKVYKIIFKRDTSHNTGRNSQLSPMIRQSSGKWSKGNNFQTIGNSSSKIVPDHTKNLKFLSEYSLRDTPLQNLLEQLNRTRSKLYMTGHKNNFSQSMQAETLKLNAQINELSLQLLSINRVSTINPQDELMKTLNSSRKQLHQGKIFDRKKKSVLPENINRISFYKNADGILGKKKVESNFRQIGNFEPWQLNLNEEDEFVPAQIELK